jgi:lysophospholipase L1-like esterase
VITVGLGDSITFLPGSWFRRTCGSGVLLTCQDAGIRGDTTTGMLARLDRDVLAAHPTIVTIMGGTNDLREKATAASIVGRLNQIIERVNAAGATVVLCTVPPRNRYARAALALNTAIRAYAKAHRVPVLDMYSIVGTKHGKYRAGMTTDGIHPNALAAAKMEAFAEKRLPKLISVPSPSSQLR